MYDQPTPGQQRSTLFTRTAKHRARRSVVSVAADLSLWKLGALTVGCEWDELKGKEKGGKASSK
jgi:hypothetical protein